MAIGLQPLPGEQIAFQIKQVAAQIAAQDITSNDVVLVVTNAEPAFAILLLGLLSQVVVVPVNPDSRSSELAFLDQSLKPKAILVPDQQAHAFARSTAAPLYRYSMDAWDVKVRLDVEHRSSPAAMQSRQLPDATALILQTSGTTGQPKFVPLTLQQLRRSAQNVQRSLSLSAADRCLHMLPMFHIGGLVDVLLAPLISGGEVLFNRGFDVKRAFEAMQMYAPSWTQTVPTVLQAMLEYAQQNGFQSTQHPLRLIRSVSAKLPIALQQQAAQVFDTSIVEIYGMTETTGLITSSPLDPALQKPGAVGSAAGPEIRIVDQQGQVQPAGQAGEVQVRGTTVMCGYLEDAVTASAFDQDWFCTGDMGYLDPDGMLYLSGRIKDIINRGGEKIAPSEIDQVAMQHPDVSDAACFAIEHPSLGETVALAVVVAAGADFSTDTYRQFLAQRLAYFKIPEHIMLVEHIPRERGKLRRHQLAELFQAESTSVTKSEIDDTARDPLSQSLAQLWQQVLELEQQVSMDDDFFFMGGDSLTATMLVNEIQHRWGVSILVSVLYESPVLSEFKQQLMNEYPQLIERILART